MGGFFVVICCLLFCGCLYVCLNLYTICTLYYFFQNEIIASPLLESLWGFRTIKQAPQTPRRTIGMTWHQRNNWVARWSINRSVRLIFFRLTKSITSIEDPYTVNFTWNSLFMDPHPTEVFSNIKLQLRSFRGPMWWNDKIILTNQKKQKVRLPEIPPSHFSWEFICLGCRSNFVKPKNGEDKWATKKTLITFHYTGWLIGILIKVYYNPYIPG